MRALFLTILLVLMVVPNWSRDERIGLIAPDARVRVTPVPLDPTHPERRALGPALTYIGGIQLSSPDKVFGGWSSMRVEGDAVTLLSDGGELMFFHLDPAMWVSGVRFAHLPGGPGSGWGKEDRDSESLATDPVTGQHWVGFEQWNAIYRFSPDFSHVERWAKPPLMRGWPHDTGPETLVRLPDGHFLVIAENAHYRPGDTGKTSLIFPGDPTLPAPPLRFSTRVPAHHRPSDGVALPDGRVLLLVRRFQLPFAFSARLVLIDPRLIGRDQVLDSVEVARFEAPITRDNYEAVTLSREGDATILWIASDDNQLWPLQRSILLKFRLDPARLPAAPAPTVFRPPAAPGRPASS